MSECVVRMKMPEKCDECPAWCICGTLHKYMLGIDCDSDWTYDDLLVITVETGFVKPDNCPIICQLPEGHGRLVDADELADDMKARKAFFGRKSDPQCLVEDAATIVPADASDAVTPTDTPTDTPTVTAERSET